MRDAYLACGVIDRVQLSLGHVLHALIGRLGNDAFGHEMKAFLAAQRIDLSFVRETSEAHTGTAVITVAKADNTIVVIPGAE